MPSALLCCAGAPAAGGASIHCATEFVASQLHSHSEWLLQRSHNTGVSLSEHEIT